MKKKNNTQKVCFFCSRKLEYIDYKNVELLKKFLGNHSVIKSRKNSGTCLRHQKKIAKAIKRARNMALLPFVG